MIATARTTTSRSRLAGLMIAALLTVLVASGCQRELGGRSQGLINDARAASGLAGLVWDDQAAAKAQAWAEHLATRRSLAHSRLGDGMTNYRTLGENVGYASSIDAVHDLFMRSSQHRANILNRNFTGVGVGVAKSGDVFYVVQVFRG